MSVQQNGAPKTQKTSRRRHWNWLLAAPLVLLVVALAGLVGMIMIAALSPFGGWISSAVGVGSLTAGGALALLCRRHSTTSR